MNLDESLDMPKLFGVLSLWIGKTVVLLLSSAFSLEAFVLGNDRVTGAMAAVFVALLLTISSLTSDMIALKLGINLKNNNYKRVFLFAQASIIVFMAKLFSLVTGFGIANIFVVFVVAALVVSIDEPLLRQIKKIKLEG